MEYRELAHTGWILMSDAVTCAIRENCPPEYGAGQARLDQEVTLAIYESARRGGEPVKLLLIQEEDIPCNQTLIFCASEAPRSSMGEVRSSAWVAFAWAAG
ncbi:MAG: hypothetical protein E3J21_01800 [Anaerolineales bacterium]|nr:MAG: hypothetical protein E3J21_01800 [Anaerolineales bacterium]